MSNKSIFNSIIFVIVFLISSSIIAQTDTAKTNASNAVQPAAYNTPSGGVTIPTGTKLKVNLDKPLSTAKNPAGT